MAITTTSFSAQFLLIHMRLKTYCAWSLLGEISQALPTFPSDFESRTELNIATIQFLKARHISNIHGNLIVEVGLTLCQAAKQSHLGLSCSYFLAARDHLFIEDFIIPRGCIWAQLNLAIRERNMNRSRARRAWGYRGRFSQSGVGTSLHYVPVGVGRRSANDALECKRLDTDLRWRQWIIEYGQVHKLTGVIWINEIENGCDLQ